MANDLLSEALHGVLVSDCYGGYNDTLGGRHQRSRVHLVRDVRALVEAHSGGTTRLDLEVRARTDAVRSLWQQVRAALRLRRGRSASNTPGGCGSSCKRWGSSS